MDLPVWQALSEELGSQGFQIVAVATDDVDAARPHVEAAKPTYPCLIDADHQLGALYNLVNVPQAVWIDEAGRIVRPPENAGSHDGFRRMNRETGEMPAEELERSQRLRTFYLDAVRDWVARGAESDFALSGDEARGQVSAATDDVAQAWALFRLGRFLEREGRAEEARAPIEEAVRLHPDSWSYYRQSVPKNEMGLAAGDGFWERIDALGEKRYYPPPQMKGLSN